MVNINNIFWKKEWLLDTMKLIKESELQSIKDEIINFALQYMPNYYNDQNKHETSDEYDADRFW